MRCCRAANYEIRKVWSLKKLVLAERQCEYALCLEIHRGCMVGAGSLSLVGEAFVQV
jgi:hypothetical protein